MPSKYLTLQNIGLFFSSRGQAPVRLQTRLLLALLPSLILLIAVTGCITHRVANHFLSSALERSARLQTLAMANAVENYFEECRQDLLFLAQGAPEPQEMLGFLQKKANIGGVAYRECIFVSQTDGGHFAFLGHEGSYRQLSAKSLLDIRPNPLLLYETIKDFPSGRVWLSGIQAIELPVPVKETSVNRISTHVYRMATPWMNNNGGIEGFMLLSVDAKDIRNILSLYNSECSPIWAFTRSHELRFAYLFSIDGWELFQSEDWNTPDAELSTFLARAEYSGALGQPGLDSAFRPASKHNEYWKMVSETRQGRSGAMHQKQGLFSFNRAEQFMAYAPVTFLSAPESKEVVAGVAFMDRSRLTLIAGYEHLDIMIVFTLGAIVLAGLSIIWFCRRVTRPLDRLVNAVKTIRDSGEPQLLTIPVQGYEMNLLLDSLNGMIATMKSQLDEIRQKDRQIEDVSLRERIIVDELPGIQAYPGQTDISRIMGLGPLIEKLRNEIIKASQVDVDVLVLGETGTGKQLAAEEIHGLSKRAGRPLISINCGALDENLLLDTLFGHVKGAFTEAKTERKGAFLEAQGGTIFLDEIQVASPKVQQALLRVLETRKIKPLGSDKEITVDVRVIASSNVDLRRMINKRQFREDLYFRLKVVTIQTPALREHKENIPLLALHYLREAEALVGKSDFNFSRGALEKMLDYQWPGNIRELKNCVTRAAVMAETKIIQASEIHLENQKTPPAKPQAAVSDPKTAWPVTTAGASKTISSRSIIPAPKSLGHLNPRQRKALDFIKAKGEVSRKDYEQLHGGLPARTAVYDLQDLVKKGILNKVGRGPATRYILARNL